MSGGFLYAVVGASGSGKDTLMRKVAARRSGVVLARRVITRPGTAGGEDFEGVGEAEFARREGRGEFALTWPAHGLRYAIPISIEDEMAAGRTVLFNGSRAALGEAVDRYPDLRVLLVTASAQTLSHRLADRGRETPGAIEARLARAAPLPEQVRDVIEIPNDGTVQEAVERMLAAISHEEKIVR